MSLTCDGGKSSNTSFEPKQVGFVFADRLFCREYPSRDSKIKTSFVFGQIIALSEKTGIKETIDGVEGDWYRISDKSCWLFSGHLRIDSPPDRFLNPKQIVCNLGSEYSEGFKPLLGSYNFLSVERLDDWAREGEYGENDPPGQEVVFVTIGKYEKKGNEFFLKGERTAVFVNSRFLRFRTKLFYAKNGGLHLVLVSDEAGEYYKNRKSQGDRKSSVAYCKKFQDFLPTRKTIFFEYYIETKIEPSFPLEPLQCANQSRAAYCSGWNISE
ncbi:hypothetical protein LEP1GSC061_3199 [Leptospira wolffii serovar Khorat str. Khorat-H2]|nr:hypothetical protein LEP1GSC061_3199 [Leptospira wolffii serovar Khorat str. Khorat-H2]